MLAAVLACIFGLLGLLVGVSAHARITHLEQHLLDRLRQPRTPRISASPTLPLAPTRPHDPTTRMTLRSRPARRRPLHRWVGALGWGGLSLVLFLGLAFAMQRLGPPWLWFAVGTLLLGVVAFSEEGFL